MARRKQPTISTEYALQMLRNMEDQEELDPKSAKLRDELIELVDSRIEDELGRIAYGTGND